MANNLDYFKTAIDPKAIALIKHFESLHDGDLSKIGLQPKMDPVGIWTAGYGHALRDPKDPKKFLKGLKNKALAESLMTIPNEAEALKVLESDLINDYLPITCISIPVQILYDLKPHQIGALVSFVYNCGTGYKNRWGKFIPFAMFNNLLKLFTTNTPAYTIQNFVDYWNTSVIKSGGEVLPGLVRRRKAEAWLFRYNELRFDF